SQQQDSRSDEQIFQRKHDPSPFCCRFCSMAVSISRRWAKNRRTRPPNTSSSTSTPAETLSNRAPTTLRISANSSIAVLVSLHSPGNRNRRSQRRNSRGRNRRRCRRGHGRKNRGRCGHTARSSRRLTEDRRRLFIALGDNLHRVTDPHLRKEFVQVTPTHADAPMRHSLADRSRSIGAVNAISRN